ncbi:MAG: TldD/PmbA family protein [Euryarchaeota archaeon]|nr:TldD/PmbA family protein [Euryarchaeota archaeon]
MDVDRLRPLLDPGLQGGARYLDLRLEEGASHSVSGEDGRLRDASTSRTRGVGVRALAGGGWGFAAATLSPRGDPRAAVGGAVERAVRMARANTGPPVELAPARPREDRVETPVQRDPADWGLEERIRICRETSRAIRETPGVTKGYATLVTERWEKAFLSTEGACITQKRVFTAGLLGGVARVRGNSEWYHHVEGGYAGLERIEGLFTEAGAREVGRTAATIAGARAAPTRRLPVVLDPDFVALLVHEIVGHPVEADRVLGREAAWAGRTWWGDRVGERLVSPHLTIVSDATLGQGHVGSYPYDDEGVAPRRVVHIEGGVLRDFLHSRETAALYDTEPNGAVRATGYAFAPLIRMTNTYATPGEWTREEMMEDIREGVYLEGNKVPSIDSRRYNFQISAFQAHEIRNGEIGKPLRGASLRGNTPEFLSSIDAVGRDLRIVGIIFPACGKGDPMQSMYVGNGGPHLRGVGQVTGPK